MSYVKSIVKHSANLPLNTKKLKGRKKIKDKEKIKITFNYFIWNGNSLNYVCCIMMQLLFDVVKELNHLHVPKNEI